MSNVAKGLFVNKSNDKEIVFVSDCTPEEMVVFTEALHPVSAHSVKIADFEDKYKKVHRVEFVETED